MLNFHSRIRRDVDIQTYVGINRKAGEAAACVLKAPGFNPGWVLVALEAFLDQPQSFVVNNYCEISQSMSSFSHVMDPKLRGLGRRTHPRSLKSESSVVRAPSEHAITTYVCSAGKALHNSLGTRRRRVISFVLRPFHSQWNIHSTDRTGNWMD
jgi:hypothetical protein